MLHLKNSHRAGGDTSERIAADPTMRAAGRTRRGARGIWLLCATLVMALTGCALPAVAFAGWQFDTGVSPSLAGGGPGLVEVHQGGNGAGPLWFSTGTIPTPSGPAGAATVQWSGSEQYDVGMDPSVTVGSVPQPTPPGRFRNYLTTLVEVHQGGSGVGPLWYGTAVYHGSTFTWNNSHEYAGAGALPAVTSNDAGTVVEVDQGGSGAGPLWYRVGTLATNGSTITWGSRYQYDTGAAPSVTMSGSTVVEVHQGGAGVGELWYRVGVVSAQSRTIAWSASHPYDYGASPSVSVGYGVIKEVHQGGSGFGPLWTRTATFTSGASTINWNTGYRYDEGVSPHATEIFGCGTDNYAEVHQGQLGFGPMWYDISAGYCTPAQ